jgi:hypothetical protein
VIEAQYVVRCSGPCGLALAMNLGNWEADDLPDVFDSLDEAERAGQDAGWINCVEHAGHLIFPGSEPACLEPVCPACRESRGD